MENNVSGISQLSASVSALNSSWISDISEVNIKINEMPSSTTPGWPDAIGCTVHGWGWATFYLTHAPLTSNNLFYYRLLAGSTTYSFKFNTDGTYNSKDSISTSDCDGQSMTQLGAVGQAFNFVVSL